MTSNLEPVVFTKIQPIFFQITGNGNRVLLTIGMDGTVTGELGDMGEAASVFVNEVKRQLSRPSQPPVTDVERVARIIDPDAFEAIHEPDDEWRERRFGSQQKARTRAIAKAKTIAAMQSGEG